MTIVRLQDVESSQIAAIGHHAETETLAIQFKNWKGEIGSTYHYANVTVADYEALRDAPSIGRHFGQVIKANPQKYPYTKIADKPAPSQEAA